MLVHRFQAINILSDRLGCYDSAEQLAQPVVELLHGFQPCVEVQLLLEGCLKGAMAVLNDPLQITAVGRDKDAVDLQALQLLGTVVFAVVVEAKQQWPLVGEDVGELGHEFVFCCFSEHTHDVQPLLTCGVLCRLAGLGYLQTGRQRKPLTPGIILYWAADQNSDIQLQDVRTSDDRRCFFWYDCRLHLTFRTVKSMSNKDDGVKCPTCTPCSKRKASQIEEAMLALLTSQFRNRVYLREDRLLGGCFGATDFYIKDAHLAVELDGEQHFSKGHISCSVAKQQAIDTAKDAEYRKQGYNLLRVHHADMYALPMLLKVCLVAYTKNKKEQFHKYSERHPCTDREWGRSDDESSRLRP